MWPVAAAVAGQFAELDARVARIVALVAKIVAPVAAQLVEAVL
jgi:hypothetical protein